MIDPGPLFFRIDELEKRVALTEAGYNQNAAKILELAADLSRALGLVEKLLLLVTPNEKTLTSDQE